MFKVTRNELIRMLQDLALSHISMPAEYTANAKQLMEESDRLWPVGTDGQLDSAIDNNDLDEAFDAVQDIAVESFFKVVDFYSNPWNHPPGYVRPAGLNWDFAKLDEIRDAAVDIWEAQKV